MNRLEVIVFGGLIFGGIVAAILASICAPAFVIVGGLLLGSILGMVLFFALENLIHSLQRPR